jgi:DNA-binding response OmpR family regulator
VRTPILILTARTDVSSRVEGLDAGADDYLGKPFAIAELRARLRALLRRGAGGAARSVFRNGALRVDFGRRQVSIGDREVPITRRELEVLARLVRAEGRAVSREDLLEEIWGESTPETAASLEVIMSRLRRKLQPASAQPLIRTFRGHGYGIAPMEREAE